MCQEVWGNSSQACKAQLPKSQAVALKPTHSRDSLNPTHSWDSLKPTHSWLYSVQTLTMTVSKQLLAQTSHPSLPATGEPLHKGRETCVQILKKYIKKQANHDLYNLSIDWPCNTQQHIHMCMGLHPKTAHSVSPTQLPHNMSS